MTSSDTTVDWDLNFVSGNFTPWTGHVASELGLRRKTGKAYHSGMAGSMIQSFGLLVFILNFAD